MSLRSPRIPLLNVAVGTGEGATEQTTYPLFEGSGYTVYVAPLPWSLQRRQRVPMWRVRCRCLPRLFFLALDLAVALTMLALSDIHRRVR